MGATGWVATEARLQQQAAQYAAYDGDPNYGQKTILGIGRKWIGKRCWDCAQWTKYALSQLGIVLPSGATNQYNADLWAIKGPISTFPWDKDTTAYVLWRQSKTNPSRMSHVALCIGDGRQMDARSTAAGVVEDDSIRKFDHWACPRGLSFDSPALADSAPSTGGTPQRYEVTAPKAPLNVREAPGESSKWLDSLVKGTVVEVVSIANNWAHIRYGDGKSGYSFMGYLKKLNG